MALENINPNLSKLSEDFLYHLGLTSKDDLSKLFGDTKFVCMGGSGMRAEKVATKFSKQLGLPITRYCKDPENKIGDMEEAQALMNEVIEGKIEIRAAMERINDFVAEKAGLPTAIGKKNVLKCIKLVP